MKRLGSALLLSLLSIPVFAGPHAYFSSDENVERQLVEHIDQSRYTIEAALFEMTSPELIAALRRAAARGVQVRLVLQRSTKTDPLAGASGVDVETRRLGGRTPHGVMHHKFALFDHETVVTGSYNWTPGARHANYENALFEDDADVVKAYIRQFELLWARSRLASFSSEDNTGARTRKSKSHRSGKSRGIWWRL